MVDYLEAAVDIAALKEEERAVVVSPSMELFVRSISSSTADLKLEFCRTARVLALRGCAWAAQADDLAKLALSSGPLPNTSLALHASSSDPANSRPVDPTDVTLEPSAGPSTSEDAKSAVAISSSSNGNTHGPPQSPNQTPPEKRLPLPLDLIRPLCRGLAHCMLHTSSSQELKAAATSATKALYARCLHDLIPEGMLATKSLLQLQSSFNSSQQSQALVVRP